MSGPGVVLEFVGAARAGESWRTRWQAHLADGGHSTLVSAHAPHARFRSQPTDLALELASAVTFELDVRTDQVPGPLNTNPFVILVVRDTDASWRLLYRLSVTIAADGTPRATVGPVTTQRVGFTKEQ